MDLGSAVVGTPLVRTFTLNNGGSQGLTFSSALGSATQFVITAGANGDLDGGTSTTFQVTFTPTAAGNFNDTITVTSNDPAVPAFTIPVSALGLDPADISVTDSSDVAINDGGSLDLGETLVNTTISRTLTLTNNGDIQLDYTTSIPQGALFSVTQNATGSIVPGGTGTIEVTFTAGAQSGEPGTTLTIASNDPDNASFDINLSAVARVGLTNDVVVSTTGGTRFTPLANDVLAGDLTILSVSNSTIQISGRALVIPPGFFGTFTYVVSNGAGVTGQGSVVVTSIAGGPIAPTKLNGIITNPLGKITGWATATISATGKATVKLITPAGKATAKLTFPPGVAAIATTTKLGSLTTVRNGDGTVSMTLGTDTALLHVQSSFITAAKYHVALASIDSAIPGGGYAITTVSKKSAVKIVGLLPDGRPFSAGSAAADNGSIAFFAADVKKVNPKGYFGGELFPADVAATDITGEIAWFKPGQLPKIKGLHLAGLDTTLTANGSLYTGAPLFTGAGMLDLSGGNLTVAESSAATISALGIPTTPLGSLKTWTGAKAKTGKFAATVLVPTITKPVKGSGLYLPKSNSAWGFFPGTTVGGRIELSVQ